ncbi:Glycosyl hydrolases family 28 [Parapedobacter luteus]|uniref:Glycosyl hydrolases family 28 n=2 Tax=Parapedobacter luteus TaxID=623280 RepID=A0A1T5CFQ8_9SPHI|nr:Glycosyl hydrolases family 28 [Parapedobacter luteus]
MRKNMKKIGWMTVVAVCLVSGTISVVCGQDTWPEPDVRLPVFKTDTFDIRGFGASDAPGFVSTAAIQSAIDACHGQGGGVVLIPEGVWSSGPLSLRSGVNLHLSRHALLQFSRDFNDYPLIETWWEGLPQVRRHSPIRAEGQQNIGITGEGVIDGNGDAWRYVKKAKMTDSQWKNLVASGGVVTPDGKEWYPSESALKGRQYQDAGLITPDKTKTFFEEIADFLRPNLVVLERCERILLEGVTFQNSGAWNIHPLMSRDVTIRNITVRNPWYSQNGDGLDIESCTNVLVEGSSFDVGDDAICVKSGKGTHGRQLGMPTENLWVRNCTVFHAHGGFVVGSEMSGGARNLYVSGLTFIGTDIGLRFKTTRGRGGVVEDVYIRDIYMKDIPGEAILFDMYYEAKDPIPAAGEVRQPPKAETLPVSEETPQFRNFYIANIHCEGAKKAVFIRGLPEMPIRGIHLSGLRMKTAAGIDIQEGAAITVTESVVETTSDEPLAYVLNGRDVVFDALRYGGRVKTLLHVQGERSKGVVLHNIDTSLAEKPLQADHGAAETAVKMN